MEFKDGKHVTAEQKLKIYWDFRHFASCFFNETTLTKELYQHLNFNCGIMHISDAGSEFYERRFHGYDNIKHSLNTIIACPEFSEEDYLDLNQAISKVAQDNYDTLLNFSKELDIRRLEMDIKIIQNKIDELKAS